MHSSLLANTRLKIHRNAAHRVNFIHYNNFCTRLSDLTPSSWSGLVDVMKQPNSTVFDQFYRWVHLLASAFTIHIHNWYYINIILCVLFSPSFPGTILRMPGHTERMGVMSSARLTCFVAWWCPTPQIPHAVTSFIEAEGVSLTCIPHSKYINNLNIVCFLCMK